MLVEEITVLHQSDRGRVVLFLEPETGEKYVRKELRGPHPIYEQLKELRHPYLPRIYNVDIQTDTTAVTEEYIEGVALDAVSLRERQLTRLLLELCDVLTFLHTHNILHRDIKPSNLMLASDGHLRLIDFDAAREEKEDQGQDTRLLGTRGYAPPEQYGFAQTDARSDLYALGATFRQLLGPLSQKRRWRGILRKCTALDPKDRYSTAQQVTWAVWISRIQRWVLHPALWAMGLYLSYWVCLSAFAYWRSPEVREAAGIVFSQRNYAFYKVNMDLMKAQTEPDSFPYPAPYSSSFTSAYNKAAETSPHDDVIFSGYLDRDGRLLFGIFERNYYVMTGDSTIGTFSGLCAVDADETALISIEECEAHPEKYAKAILGLYEKSIFDTHLF